MKIVSEYKHWITEDVSAGGANAHYTIISHDLRYFWRRYGRKLFGWRLFNLDSMIYMLQI